MSRKVKNSDLIQTAIILYWEQLRTPNLSLATMYRNANRITHNGSHRKYTYQRYNVPCSK